MTLQKLILALSCLILAGSSNAHAAGTPSWEPTVSLLVTGLEGASGSAIGPDGALYVTEGAVGRISRVDPKTGEVTTFASGLPPWIIPLGGAIDVAFIGETAYVLVTLVSFIAAEDDDIVGIYRVDGPDSFTVIADLGKYSFDNPPETDFDVPTGLQYRLEPFRGGFLVTDANHNRVLYVKSDGEVSEVIAFDNTVPTGLTVWGNLILNAHAGPVPHLPEDGKVVAFNPRSATAVEVASGAPLLTDVKFGLGRSLYALSHGEWDGDFAGDAASPGTGALLKVNGDGTLSIIVEGLDRPTSMQFIGNAAYVVTLGGEIWKIDNVSGPPFGVVR